METAFPAARAREIETRRVLRDGSVVAVLRTLDYGSSIGVVAEFGGEAAGSPAAARVRPYTFPDVEEAAAFVEDATASFAYLGCEIRQG